MFNTRQGRFGGGKHKGFCLQFNTYISDIGAASDLYVACDIENTSCQSTIDTKIPAAYQGLCSFKQRRAQDGAQVGRRHINGSRSGALR